MLVCPAEAFAAVLAHTGARALQRAGCSPEQVGSSPGRGVQVGLGASAGRAGMPKPTDAPGHSTDAVWERGDQKITVQSRVFAIGALFQCQI